MYKIESNQLRQKGGTTTCYYIVNGLGQMLNFKTLKPYKGKNVNLYAIYDITVANEIAEKANGRYMNLEGLERYPEFNSTVQEISDMVITKIQKKGRKIKSELPYKDKFLLEEVIKSLELKL